MASLIGLKLMVRDSACNDGNKKWVSSMLVPVWMKSVLPLGVAVASVRMTFYV